MKKPTTKIGLVAKLIGGTLFLGVFAFNVVSFVQKDAAGVSFSALKAYAQSGGSSTEEEATGYDHWDETEGTDTQSEMRGTAHCTRSRTWAKGVCSGSGTLSCYDYGPNYTAWTDWSCL